MYPWRGGGQDGLDNAQIKGSENWNEGNCHYFRESTVEMIISMRNAGIVICFIADIAHKNKKNCQP